MGGELRSITTYDKDEVGCKNKKQIFLLNGSKGMRVLVEIARCVGCEGFVGDANEKVAEAFCFSSNNSNMSQSLKMHKWESKKISSVNKLLFEKLF